MQTINEDIIPLKYFIREFPSCINNFNSQNMTPFLLALKSRKKNSLKFIYRNKFIKRFFS